MINEAYFSVTGYVATDPKVGYTRDGIRMLTMRVGWTPRRLDRVAGGWVDQPSSFISVQCFRKVAENAAFSLRRGDPILIKGTLRVREYSDQAGAKRISVDVVADTIGHDMSRGMSSFSRVHASQQLTAAEREMAAEREPLPGDRAAGLTSAESGSEGVLSGSEGVLSGSGGVLPGSDGVLPGPDGELAGTDAALALAGSADADLDDQDFEMDADEAFDHDEHRSETLTESPEPVPALV